MKDIGEKSKFRARTGNILVVIPLEPEAKALTPDDEEALLVSGRDLTPEELFALAAWPLVRFSDEELESWDVHPSRTP